MDYNYNTRINPALKYTPGFMTRVNAIYTPALLECDYGNPYIEALPAPVTAEGLARLYYTPCAIKPDPSKPKDVQVQEVQLLRNIRLPLPFISRLEAAFSSALYTSYRNRAEVTIDSKSEVVVNDGTFSQAQIVRPVYGGDTGCGFSLLGLGGTGKSLCVHTMLKRYPQTIYHDWAGQGRFVQIVWLYVITPANSNLQTLYNHIGAAIDVALGNTTPFYEKAIAAKRTVGDKADYVARFIRQFNIGAIILDEIQNIDSRLNTEGSMASLMTIINSTKVAFCVIGTEEAFKPLFRTYYLARRAADIIETSEYCDDRACIDVIMSSVMQINWCKTPFKPTKEHLDAMYDVTRGIIDRIMTVWTQVQTAYVNANEKPEITPKFIKDVAEGCRPRIAEYTAIATERAALEALSQALPEPVSGTGPVMSVPVPQRNAEPSSSDELEKAVFIRVKQNLFENDRLYNDGTILDGVRHVMGLKANRSAGEDELVKKSIKYISSKKSDRRRKPANPSSLDLDRFRADIIGN